MDSLEYKFSLAIFRSTKSFGLTKVTRFVCPAIYGYTEVPVEVSAQSVQLWRIFL